jgi:hypothetical protein
LNFPFALLCRYIEKLERLTALKEEKDQLQKR